MACAVFILSLIHLRRPRCDTVDDDTVLRHLKRCLGRSVGDLTCKRLSRIGGNIYNSTEITAVIYDFARHHTTAAHINGKGTVNDVLGYSFNGIKAVFIICRRVIDENINFSEFGDDDGVDLFDTIFI